MAETSASDAWVAAHVLGILAFILLPLGLQGLMAYADDGRLAYLGSLLCGAGSGLTVAFFDAEAFGLRSIGQQAIREGRADALELGQFGPRSTTSTTYRALDANNPETSRTAASERVDAMAQARS